MIYDCFVFNDELELLEMRLMELYHIVDKFVLCEREHTFTGKPKPLHYADNREMFKPWADKIVHLVGQFHSDFEGGTIMEVRRRAPDVRVLSISMQAVDATSLREDDVDRADIVIYTGEKN